MSYSPEYLDSYTEWFSQVNPATTLATTATHGTTLVPVVNGTDTAYSDSDGRWINFATTTLLNALGGWTNATFTHTQTRFEPVFTSVIKTGSNATDIQNCTIRVGLYGDASFSVGYGFEFNSGVGANWLLQTGTTSSGDRIDTGIAIAADTKYVLQSEYLNIGSGTINYYMNGGLIGTVTNVTSKIANTTGLQYRVLIINASAGTARNLRIKRIHMLQK